MLLGKRKIIKLFGLAGFLIAGSACTQTSEVHLQEINQTQNNLKVEKTIIKKTNAGSDVINKNETTKKEPSGWSNIPNSKHLKPQKCIGC